MGYQLLSARYDKREPDVMSCACVGGVVSVIIMADSDPRRRKSSSDGFSCRLASLEVRVPGLAPREEVRVSGSVPSLGQWAVALSVPLAPRERSCDVWCVDVSVPVDLTVEYRYLVVQPITTGDKTALRVLRRETTIHPRQICLRETGTREAKEEVDTPGTGAAVLIQDGLFGELASGEKAEDEGWLLGTSELQLQLHNSESPPIRIDTLPDAHRYSVKVQSMNYCAKTEDVCEVCQCSAIRVKVLDREQGSCEVREQGECGWPYLPHQFLEFFTEAPHFTYCAFIVDLFSAAGSGGWEGVGRASILPQQLTAEAGTLILTVFSPQLLPIGTVTFTYLLVHPVRDYPSIHRTHHSYANYWKKHKRPLDVGHRGLGDSYHGKEELKPSATENTILSLKRAGAHGADYVEFDVQLTRDLVPVVYHDFFVCTTLARKGFSSAELYQVHVHELTLSQLCHLKLDHSSLLETLGPTSGDATPYQSDSPYVSSDETPPPTPGTHWGRGSPLFIDEGPESKTFPTLEQVFKALPRHIGFNIEVKYPVPEQNDSRFHFPYFERNMMADIILKTVYKHAHRRKIIFSCFDPSMCTILRRKQPKYPVLFLSTNMAPPYATPVDLRARTIQDAMMFAKAEKLLGINLNSTPLLQDHRLVEAVTSTGLVLFTWGRDNNDFGNIALQKKLGVAAVIYDRITHLIPPQRNMFEEEEEEESRQMVEIRVHRTESSAEFGTV